jgi:elongation factor G
MIRTVAPVGHAQSGKTTLTEALLYKTGAKDRMGRAEDGTTTTDYTPEANSMAFKKVMAEASPTLLEPIYEIKVLAPQERVGDILSDLQARRGRILGMEQEGALAAVRAEVPLAEVLEYYKALPGLTGGAGAYTLEFSHYQEVPPPLAQKIIQSRAQEG